MDLILFEGLKTSLKVFWLIFFLEHSYQTPFGCQRCTRPRLLFDVLFFCHRNGKLSFFSGDVWSANFLFISTEVSLLSSR